MKKLFYLVVGTWGALLFHADAQNPPDENALPPGPLIVSQMPDSAQWRIDYTYSDTPKPGQPTRLDGFKQEALNDPALAKAMENPAFVFGIQNIRPLQIVFTQSGNVRHEERTFEQGYKGEMWSQGDVEVERQPNLQGLVAHPTEGAAGNSFPDFDWISKGNFIGIQTRNNVKCLAFKEDQYDKDHNMIGTKYAFVDIKTRYPVAYLYAVETSQYTILPPPTGALTEPDEFVAAGESHAPKNEASDASLSRSMK